MEYVNYLWLAIPLLILVLVIGVQVVGGPLMIHSRQTQPLLPELQVLDPALGELPTPILRYFTKIARELGPEGFEVLGYFFLGKQVPGVQAVLAYLEKPATREPALASAISAKMGDEPYRLQLGYLEFFTNFVDGVGVTTSNSPMVGVFALAPGRTIIQFAGESNAQRLYRLHRAMVARFGSPVRQRLREGQDVSAYIRDNLVREIERQVETGYYARDDEAGLYRPTWKGACLMAWKCLPGVRAIRNWRSRLRAARIKRQLEEPGIA